MKRALDLRLNRCNTTRNPTSNVHLNLSRAQAQHRQFTHSSPIGNGGHGQSLLRDHQTVGRLFRMPTPPSSRQSRLAHTATMFLRKNWSSFQGITGHKLKDLSSSSQTRSFGFSTTDDHQSTHKRAGVFSRELKSSITAQRRTSILFLVSLASQPTFLVNQKRYLPIMKKYKDVKEFWEKKKELDEKRKLEEKEKQAQLKKEQTDTASDSRGPQSPRLVGAISLNAPPTSIQYGDVSPNVEQPNDPRLIEISFIGAPNAGKSTLMNRFLKQKVSIVSPKSQTTRDEIIGICTRENRQIIFHDTPGIVPIKDSKKVQRDIVTTAWNTINDTDLVLVIIDAVKTIDLHILHILDRLSDISAFKKKRMICVLNKVDLATDEAKLKQRIEKLQERNIFEKIFTTSAKYDKGTEEVLNYLLEQAEPREWRYPKEAVEDEPPLDKVTSLIRETFFYRFYAEIPYILDIQNFAWTELKDGTTRIDYEVFVNKKSQQKMLIGKKGATIQWVRYRAEIEIAKYLNRKVILHLSVKVK